MMPQKPYGDRKFYDFPKDYELVPPETHYNTSKEEIAKLIKYIDENVIGKDLTFAGPFGRRKVVYCDYTASARSLQFIEDYILREVLPLYGNTHTTTTVTSLQSTLYRDEARDIIRNAVNASEQDVVLFAGHGCTGAVHKLIHALNLTSPPIVFVGPCEHHSNLLPWRELGAKIVRILETKEGVLDLTDLQKKLAYHRNLGTGEVMIGCFSAASNITGILADDVATTILLHQYGALAFWDYATAAPYVTLDMNPLVPGIDQDAPHKDAIFFSGHKFIGGVQSPGILIAKKSLFMNPVPQGCGGGTVFFVTREDHRYLKNTELREEGGTAAIVESIRAGMVMKLKQAVGSTAIMEHEDNIVRTVISFLRKIPEIILLGSSSPQVKRLAVFSIMVRHPRGSYLHHNFVCAVLNDIFGIQARGGCACAGPYAQDLMGIDEKLASNYEDVLMEDSRLDRHHLRRREEHSSYEMLRPGFTRISFPYFMSDTEVAFVLEALKMVATEGWKLLPQYILNPETGEWRHNNYMTFRERKWLGSIRYVDGKMCVNERRNSGISPCPTDFNEVLKTARTIFNKARKIARRHPLADQCTLFDTHLDSLRWFMLPSEAQDLLLGHSQNVKHDVPFTPTVYSGSRPHDDFNFIDNVPPPHLLVRHMSLMSTPEINSTMNRDIKILRQRSESNSPSRYNLSKLCGYARERCYSLGSTLIPDVTVQNISPRQRYLSCSSQPDETDSGETVGNFSSLRNTPDLVYVEGVTKELAIEIKSELRGVIASVEDVLSDSNDSESKHITERRLTFDSNLLKTRKSLSLPLTSNQTSTDTSNDAPNSYCGISTLSAEKFSEYLLGFTSDVVSEMKSELKGVVNAVDGLISPAAEGGRITFYRSQQNKAKALLDEEKIIKTSQDSGINMTEHDPSPSLDEKIIEYPQIQEEDEVQVTLNHKFSTNPSWHAPPKEIWKPTCQAIEEFEMIQDQDRILVCLSGGKDSLSLVHSLHQYQCYCRSRGINFIMGVATVDPGSSAYNPRPLVPYLKSLGIEYHYEQQNILDQATNAGCKSVCSFCSRMKRGRLYATARKHGYNVLALGQHLDDLAESFIMSAFHNGYLRSMKAHYIVRDRDIRVIRPFIYVRERSLRQFAESRRLPVISENCPACFDAPKERHRVKQLLAQQEILFPKLFLSLKSAIKPLISHRYTGLESNAYSKRPNKKKKVN